jgi:hypothetical protein
LTISQETGERFSDPYLHRLRGDILLKRDPAKPALAEEAFQTAIAIARQQGARSFDLLAALALAKLYQSIGRPADAHAVLAPAIEGFFGLRRRCPRSPRRRRCSVSFLTAPDRNVRRKAGSNFLRLESSGRQRPSLEPQCVLGSTMADL